jgi:anti-sigma factor RsiW
MNCQECREIISAHVDNEADGGELASMEAHLATCADCRRFQADMKGLRNLLRSWTDESPGRRAGLPMPVKSSRPFVRPFLAWGMVSALLLAAGLGYLAGRESSVRRAGHPAPSDSYRVSRRTIYPAKNEIHETLDLEGMDASRARLR